MTVTYSSVSKKWGAILPSRPLDRFEADQFVVDPIKVTQNSVTGRIRAVHGIAMTEIGHLTMAERTDLGIGAVNVYPTEGRAPITLTGGRP